MKGLGCAVALFHVVFVMPLWYYLLYRILEAVRADTAMWAAYWVYVPLGLILNALGRALEQADKADKA